MPNIEVTLTSREVATILHALRSLQEREYSTERYCLERGPECDHFDEHPILSASGIDALCYRININP